MGYSRIMHESIDGRFRRLERIHVRQGWPDEARHFTPWLAANLDYLGSEIGLALELKGQEHQVGRYYLDLLLEDAAGRVVIVENQFGQTDHDHLGKLLTYCAGTQASVIVWIAETLTAEHIAALEWLNENTITDVGFFGVEVQLLRIADSPFAPHFDVVVRPNEWKKEVRQQRAQPTVWDWEAYARDLGVPADRIQIGRRLVRGLEEVVRDAGLPWQIMYRKGYVAFQRPGEYNVIIVDIALNRPPRLAIKLPAPLSDLGLINPFPDLVSSWLQSEFEWGWTLPSAEAVDLETIVRLVMPFHPERGPMLRPGVPLPSSESSTSTEQGGDV